MILIIDKKKIDFTIEDEKFLNEIIEKISTWLSESQLIVEKLFINNEDFSMQDLNVKLDGINTIEIETLSFRELNINNLSWIKYFFERIILAIEKWDRIILDQVKVEIPFVLSHLPSLLSLDNKTPENSYSDKIIEYLKLYNYFNCNEENINKKEVLQLFTNITILLQERLNEYTNSLDELNSSIKVLSSLKDDIVSVSLFLQTGKESEAALIMNNFINIFNKIVRIINFNINYLDLKTNTNLNEFTDGLDIILTELLEGYESQDTVLIGDILEYELTPRILKLEEIFN